MKARITLRILAEPFAYLVIVAAFGIITSVASQTQGDERSGDSEFVRLNLENNIEALFFEESNEIEI